jgi:hypothetical protein
MTALQKTLVTATIAVLAGAGIYEARQASQLREQVQTLQQQQTPLAEQIQKLQRQHEDTLSRFATLREDNERLRSNRSELLKLRAEATRLLANENAAHDTLTNQNDPAWVVVEQYATRDLWNDGLQLVMNQNLNLNPQQKLQLDEVFGRITDDRGFNIRPEYEAEVRGLLTPEQAKQYDALTAYRTPQGTKLDGHFTALATAAYDVSVLERQLGLTPEQQSKAVNLLTAAFNDETASPPDNSPEAATLAAMSSEERHIMRKAEALRGVLTEEQFAIYQRYASDMLKVARMQAVEKQ